MSDRSTYYTWNYWPVLSIQGYLSPSL